MTRDEQGKRVSMLSAKLSKSAERYTDAVDRAIKTGTQWHLATAAGNATLRHAERYIRALRRLRKMGVTSA